MKNVLKKIFVFSLVVFCAGFLLGDSAFAADTNTEDCRLFLGMSSWDCDADLNGIDGTEKLKTSIWIIVANIANDATILAAYLTLIFILYGGYLYIFSGGDAGKVANGKKTLTAAFIGLGIVILANVIFNGIKFALLKGAGGGNSDLYGLPKNEADVVFLNAISWAVGVAGFVAAIFLVYGGVSYMTSSGDAGKLAKAKNAIIYSLIGLIIVGLAEIIMAFVSQEIRKSVGDIQIDNRQIAIIKEVYEK